MAEYADPSLIKERTGISASDLSNVANSTELDAMILDLNERASEAIERYANRDFEDHASVTDKIDGNDRLTDEGHGRIKLPGAPVRSISEIKIDGDVVPSSEYRLVQPNSYDGGTPVNAGIVERKNTVWPKGWENIEITYTWGYSSPPSGVRGVAEDLVVDVLRASLRNDDAGAAESVSIDGFSTSYFTGKIEREEQHKDRLRRYRRIAMA